MSIGKITKEWIPFLAAAEIGTCIVVFLVIKIWNSCKYAPDPRVEISKRLAKARDVGHLFSSPLSPLVEKIQRNAVWGFFHGFGKGKVDGMNLQIKLEKDVIELSFQVTHVFRRQLSIMIEQLSRVPEQFHFERDGQTYQLHVVGYQLHVVGLGTIGIGANIHCQNLYDRVVVRIDQGKTLFDLHKLLAFVDLTDVLKVSSPEDSLRLKLGMLFRVFCPRKATLLERTESFFNLPVDRLKNEMIRQAPQMKDIFDQFLSQMELRDVLPGKKRYAIKGLAQKIHTAGGRGLITFVGRREKDNPEELFETAANIWEKGLLSTSFLPHKTTPLYQEIGSDDCVWCHLVTQRDCKEGDFISPYRAPFIFVLPLSALEMGSYQFYEALYGFRFGWTLLYPDNDPNKKPSWEDYLNRPSILELTERLQQSAMPNHEVMVKEAAQPIRMMVPDQKTFDDFKGFLRKKGMIFTDEFFNNYVRVGHQITEEVFRL